MPMSGVHKAESKVATTISPDPLDALLEASASLLSSPAVASVVSRVLDLARQVIVADAYAVWHASEDNHWKVVASAGLPSELDTELITSDSERQAIPREPYFVPDVFCDPRLAGRRELYRHQGIRSILVLPLILKGEPGGTITFYFRENPLSPQRN